ncbi:hypothetical protein ACMZOO_05150 [Catenovulum sp. SX2]|uniref:hypothetical protein n=1 Tax=Catenovulum sp. SX2 TaxID=3398614 RepID=UPI003F85C462
MKTIMLSIKNLILVIGVVGSFFSIATYFVATQTFALNSNAENSPNIASSAPVTVNYASNKNSKDWFSEYEKYKPNITKQQYELIAEGMTYREVVKILGIEGVEQGSSAGHKHYAWGTAPFFYLHMSFKPDGRLQWKANSGLF